MTKTKVKCSICGKTSKVIVGSDGVMWGIGKQGCHHIDGMLLTDCEVEEE